jgi:CHAD domain-containing protein
MDTPPSPPPPCTLARRAALEALWERLDTMRGQAEAAAAGGVDGVHDLRVASRRVAATLGLLRPLAPPAAHAALLHPVRAITRLLGRPRELDVMIGQLDALDLPGDTPVAAARDAARDLLAGRRAEVAPCCAQAAATLRSAAFLRAEAGLAAALDPGTACWLELARHGLRRPAKRLRRAFRHWHESARDEDLHEVRIAFKKLRYACEVHAPRYGAPMRDLLHELKRTQETLGQWNDCRVLAGELTGLRAVLPEARHAGLDTLIAVITAQGDAARQAFDTCAGPWFEKSRQRAMKSVFAAPEHPCCRAGLDA